MRCPDDLDRELWLAGALPRDEMTRLAEHVADCPSCESEVRAARRVDRALGAALTLDAAELAYLDTLDLARRWHTVAQPSLWWYWLAFLTTLATCLAWTLAGPVVAGAREVLLRTGLGIILGRGLIVTLSHLSQALLDLADGPLPVYSLPLLALLGLALLAWPWRAGQSPVPAR